MAILDELIEIIARLISGIMRDRALSEKLKKAYYKRYHKKVSVQIRNLERKLQPWNAKLKEMRLNRSASAREHTVRGTKSNPQTCRACRYGRLERAQDDGTEGRRRIPVICSHPEGLHKPYKGSTRPASCPLKLS